jgi:hypothetical protein
MGAMDISARLDSVSTAASDAEEAYAELMAIVVAINTEILAEHVRHQLGVVDEMLEQLKIWMAKLREKLEAITEQLPGFQSFAIMVGAPATLAVTVTFGDC